MQSTEREFLFLLQKTDNDMSGMSQQMPIDITSPTTPSDHGSNVSCPQSQPSHSGM